jgi:hypothetical protein
MRREWGSRQRQQYRYMQETRMHGAITILALQAVHLYELVRVEGMPHLA